MSVRCKLGWHDWRWMKPLVLGCGVMYRGAICSRCRLHEPDRDREAVSR